MANYSDFDGQDLVTPSQEECEQLLEEERRIENFFLPSVEVKCRHCNFTYLHPVDSRHEYHITCMCMAFSQQAICCVYGFKNLLHVSPPLCTYFMSHLPNKFNMDIHLAYRNSSTLVPMLRNRYLKIRDSCSYVLNRIDNSALYVNRRIVWTAEKENDHTQEEIKRITESLCI